MCQRQVKLIFQGTVVHQCISLSSGITIFRFSITFLRFLEYWW